MRLNDLELLSNNFRKKEKNYTFYAKITEYLAIILSLIIILINLIPAFIDSININLNWVLTLSTLITQIVSLYIKLIAKTYHIKTRDTISVMLLINSFGENKSLHSVLNFKEFSERPLQKGTTQVENNANSSNITYYSSSEPEGISRFIQNLKESIFFTKELFKIQISKYHKKILSITFIVILIFLICIVFSGLNKENIIFITIATVSLIPSFVTQLIKIKGIQDAILNLDNIFEKIHALSNERNLLDPKIIPIILNIYCKYAAITNELEGVDTKIYNENRDKLKKYYAEVYL